MAVDTEDKALAWLRRFGYLWSATPTPDELVAAIAKMQRVYGLPTTGELNAATRRAMGLFRCSHRDHGIVTVPSGTVGAVPAGTTCRWKKGTVTYAVNTQFALGDNRDACLEMIRHGFRTYEPLTGLRFVETTDYGAADIQILTGTGAATGMDGPGNVLALSGSPCGTTDKQLRSIFDTDEPWNLALDGPGIIFGVVWMHELGHLVGLTHSTNPRDLMSPYYNPVILYPQRGDRQRLASLYDVPYVEQPESLALDVGAYSVTGILAVRHDGGVSIHLRDLIRA